MALDTSLSTEKMSVSLRSKDPTKDGNHWLPFIAARSPARVRRSSGTLLQNVSDTELLCDFAQIFRALLLSCVDARDHF